MTVIHLVTALLLLIVVLALLARRLRIPLPILNAVAGLALGVLWRSVPGLPALSLPPKLVLAALLPPLLAYASFSVPLGAFRANLRPITLLAVGLVGATMAAAAAATKLVLPAVSWAAALALGAIVAPPDVVAATSVGGRLGIRNRLVIILEGEGLVNDATAFVLYALAVEALSTGVFTWGHAALELALSAPLGIAAGLLIGWPSTLLRRRLQDPVVETVLSLALPYVAYLGAQLIGGSPILSVVALGFLLRRRSRELGAPETRLTLRTVWRTLDFVINGFVFMIVGITLGEITRRVSLSSEFLFQAAVVTGAVVLIRIAWMFMIPQMVAALTTGEGEAVRSWRERLVLGWAGMRGVVSIALALAIPVVDETGDQIQMRSQLVLLALAVVATTLIVQGLTLAPLIRVLGLDNPREREEQEQRARHEAERSARAVLARRAKEGQLSHAECDAAMRWLSHTAGLERTPLDDSLRTAMRESLEAARTAIQKLRDDGELRDELAEELESSLDVDEVQLALNPTPGESRESVDA
jgi:CPA1 family monovalent cation:H+ antiporter